MEQENNQNKKKKNILYTIIAVSILLIAVSGVTYAYFAVGFTNNSDTKTIVTAVKASDMFTATGNGSLTLNVTSENMDNDDASDSYTSYTSDSTTLDVSLTAGSGNATCTYDLAIVSEKDTYTKTTGLGSLFEYTVQGKDNGKQKFAEINVDDALNSDIEAGESDETGTQVTEGILGHYTISDAYDEGDTQTTTTQTWTITSKFYNLAHDQAEQLGKTYVHTVKVVNVKCTNSNEAKESDVKVVSGDTDTIGSVISIGDEEFYVISSDDESVTMLAKYNLLVGNNFYQYDETSCINDGHIWEADEKGEDYDCVDVINEYSSKEYSGYSKTIPKTTSGYNLQSSTSKGMTCDTYIIYDSDENEIAKYTASTKVAVFKSLTSSQISNIGYIGCEDYSKAYGSSVVEFDNNYKFWSDNSSNLLEKYGTSYPAWIYDDDNVTIKTYVNNYKALLESKYDVSISNARIIKLEELVGLGCVDYGGNSYSCLTNDVISNNRTWIFDSNYWTGTAVGGSDIATVFQYLTALDFNEDNEDNIYNSGVRPVITIAKSEF